MAASADVLFYNIFSKRHCWIYCSFTLHNCFILKPKFTLICFHSLYHSLPFVVPLVVTRCHSLSLVITHCHSLYHSLYYSSSLFVIRCITCCYSLLFSATRHTTRCHPLSLDVPPLVCLFINYPNKGNKERGEELFIRALSLKTAINKRTIMFIYTISLLIIYRNMQNNISLKIFLKGNCSEKKLSF